MHQVWDPWRIDGGIVTIYFILSSTTLFHTSSYYEHPFLFMLTFTIYSYTLTHMQHAYLYAYSCAYSCVALLTHAYAACLLIRLLMGLLLHSFAYSCTVVV
jgi:hypothetical protein